MRESLVAVALIEGFDNNSFLTGVSTGKNNYNFSTLYIRANEIHR